MPVPIPANVIVQRSSDLWFHDGTVIIRCYERDNGVVTAVREFRVYRGILEKHSDGILTGQQGADHLVSEICDGCPVLPLYDDPIEDMERLLKVIYLYGDPSNLEIDSDIVQFSTALRLCIKYQFFIIKQVLVNRLLSCFPTTLEEFRKTSSTTMFDGYEVAVVNLARYCNILQVLPTAMYKIAAYSPDSVFTEGVRLPDGSISQLSQTDERQCLLARTKMQCYMHNRITQLIWAEPCAKKACDCAFQIKLEVDICCKRINNKQLGPLHGDAWAELRELPGSCSVHLWPDAHRYQERAWDLLPKWFLGLDSWDQLLQDNAADF